MGQIYFHLNCNHPYTLSFNLPSTHVLEIFAPKRLVVRNCSVRKNILMIQQQPLLLDSKDILPYATVMHNQPLWSKKSPKHE